jgi:hypothetical protein
MLISTPASNINTSLPRRKARAKDTPYQKILIKHQHQHPNTQILYLKTPTDPHPLPPPPPGGSSGDYRAMRYALCTPPPAKIIPLRFSLKLKTLYAIFHHGRRASALNSKHTRRERTIFQKYKTKQKQNLFVFVSLFCFASLDLRGGRALVPGLFLVFMCLYYYSILFERTPAVGGILAPGTSRHRGHHLWSKEAFCARGVRPV